MRLRYAQTFSLICRHLQVLDIEQEHKTKLEFMEQKLRVLMAKESELEVDFLKV